VNLKGGADVFEVSARSNYADSGIWNEVPEPPEFLEKAARKGRPKDLFYPNRGDGRPMEALAICSLCVVKSDCLEYAIEHKELYGIWGGKTERQRRAMLRKVGVRTASKQLKPRLKSECKRGHAFNAENTSFIGGRRHCLVCKRISSAERKARKGGEGA